MTLVELARRGLHQELIERLVLRTKETHTINCRGVPMSERDKLYDEALWYARAGDLSEAAYRLEQARRCQ